jgi:hypothetical protein
MVYLALLGDLMALKLHLMKSACRIRLLFRR